MGGVKSECIEGSTYQSNPTQTFCLTCSTCPAGTYETSACTTTADTVCESCLAGSASSGGASAVCTPCTGDGQYSETDSSIACQFSPAGSIPNADRTGIVPCRAGKFSNGGTSSCTACPIGKYSDTPGSVGCKACELGSVTGYIANTGTTSCLPCSPGSYSNDGQHCLDCDGNGQYSDKTGAYSCKTAKAGYKPTEDRKAEVRREWQLQRPLPHKLPLNIVNAHHPNP